MLDLLALAGHGAFLADPLLVLPAHIVLDVLDTLAGRSQFGLDLRALRQHLTKLCLEFDDRRVAMGQDAAQLVAATGQLPGRRPGRPVGATAVHFVGSQSHDQHL